jgi:transcription elongation factor GreA-like protein
MHEELEKAVSAGTLNAKAAEALDRLQPGTYCLHKSWGFGKVAEWNTLTGQILIDFKGKKGHPMQLQYAADTLLPVPNEHFLAQMAENPEATKASLKENPVAIVQQILQDAGGKATADQITTVMVPNVMDAAAFKKWWESAKKKLKADGR